MRSSSKSLASCSDRKTDMKRRIGILGGTFDPVHMGHICLAEDAARQEGLDRVFFVPARLQPFKLEKHVSSGDDRLAMLRIATKGLAYAEVSEIELDSEGISYTYLTLREFRKRCGDDGEIYFITGTDAFLGIEKWMNSEELLTSYSFIVGTRPGYRQEELEECIEGLRKRYPAKIVNIENRLHDISATEIRRRIHDGRDTEGMLPPGVEEYIREKDLYIG